MRIRARLFHRLHDLAAMGLLAGLLSGGIANSSRAAGARIPVIREPWVQIAGDPDLGELTNPNQQPVDFGIWQAADGTWQLWSCIRGTKEPGKTRLFYHWEGEKLTDPNWRPMGIAMHAEAKFGEIPGGLQAPYIFKTDEYFEMFYGGWEDICSATSTDGKTFERKLNGDGKATLFRSPLDYAQTRDPMLIRIGDLWHCYYTAHTGKKGADFCRTSKDLRSWSEARMVAAGGQSGSGNFSAECPFVVELEPGQFYLFRTQHYGTNQQTSIYFSNDPLDFGVDHDEGHFVCTLPVAAPEIFKHEGQYYIAALLPSLKGIQIARLDWMETNVPYAPSKVIKSITWDWSTYTNAAPGSDLWPVTWGPDDHLYAAWGDGGGFGGTDSEGRVALGFARIEGGPGLWRGFNVNGGKNPEHAASFRKKGKTTGVAFVDGVLYAMVNLQDGTWPNVNHVLVWSTDKGATWTRADWLFPKGEGNLKLVKILAFGKDYGGVPEAYGEYVYFYGPRQSPDRGSGNRLYLARVPRNKVRERASYEFFQKVDGAGAPVWAAESTQARAIFTDVNGVTSPSVVYDPGLKRFLLTCFHTGPGQLGVFDGPTPWGPWTTIAYYENWGEMGTEGEGLNCGFPQKWMSADGLTLWSVFSVYGEGAKKGIHAHDKFNLIKATLHTFDPDSHEPK